MNISKKEMYSSIILAVLTVVLGFILYKPGRFYLLSFIFPWLYDHPYVSMALGIKYEDDRIWKTNRHDTQVYMKGFFVWIFTKFSGMGVILPDDIRKSTMRLQKSECDKFDMTQYFEEIDGKTITLLQFEDYLAGWILRESNRVFKIVDEEKEKILYKGVCVIKSIVNGLLGDICHGLYIMITNFGTVVRISKIIRSVPEDKRLFLFVPQLTLVSTFVRTIAKTGGNFTNVHPHNFLESSSKFSVFVDKGQLTFVTRHDDDSDNSNNRSFGPMGCQCPGSISVMKFYKIIIDFLKCFEIKVEGTPKYSTGRFATIINKDEILVSFKRLSQ